MAKTGKHYRLRDNGGILISTGDKAGDLVFWAQDGLIAMQDEESGEFYVLTRAEFLERLRAVNRMNKREVYYDDRMKIQNFIDDGIKCAREAKAQGDPTDPKVIEWFIKHRPDRKTSAVMWETPLPGALPQPPPDKPITPLTEPDGKLSKVQDPAVVRQERSLEL